MKKIKFLKLKKVKIANVSMISKVIGGDKTDSCDNEANCVPEITQTNTTSNEERECNNSILVCVTDINYDC